MKNRLFSRSVATLIVLSLLLTGLGLPFPAAAVPVNVDLSEDIIDDGIILEEEIVLRADDPIIAEESMILEYIDSAQFNAAQHTQRLTELEDLNTYVFANADGTRSVYMMHENVKFVDEAGFVVEKDISLTSEATGYGIVRSDIDLLIPITPAQGIDMEYWGFDIKLTPQGISETTSAVQSNNSIVYDNAYGENTKLIYTPLLSGIKEDIVLTEYTANASYTFLLETNGLYLYDNDNSYYLADNVKETPIFYLGDVLIYDAIGKPDLGTLTAETITEGQEYLITVTANDDFLSDPTTVYPVTIDPSITISDSSASDSIIDAPIFQSLPTQSFGAFTYNRVGNAGGVYGVGRTVVKLSGLTNSSEYQSITADQIANVTFYAKEASGSAAQFINLYPITGNTTWTESTVTWNNIVSYDTSVNYGNTMSYDQWTAFNITDLVKAWKSNTYSADAGFIMMNENEANNKCFCSSEFSTAASRPYVVLTYTQNFSLNYANISVPEASTVTLAVTANPGGYPVTWNTNNSSVATVSASGVVTTHKSGTVTITASIVDSDGVTQEATCHIYVYVTSGVYYIQNLYSGYYLHVKSGGIKNFTDVQQYINYDESEDEISAYYRIRQMWRVSYLGSGRYSVRPLSKLDMGLDVTDYNVDIFHIGTDDTLSGVPTYAQWTIEWITAGYVFKNDGDSECTMQPENASAVLGKTVVASSYTGGVDCKWALVEIDNPPSGAYLYDHETTSVVSTTTRTLDEGTSCTVDELGIVAVMYSGSFVNQTFRWSSSNPSVASVDRNSGLISANLPGTALITATSQYGGYTATFILKVNSLDPFHSSNIQYMRFVQIKGADYWGLGQENDHTINIVKSTLLADDYCVIHDNINAGYYRALYINNELKTTLNNLEAGYQEHYSIIPLFNTTTTEENAAHSAKGKTDQLVEAGYFASGSSEYYGAWAYNYVSSINRLDYWIGVVDTATAAFQVYLTLTTFYSSYMSANNTSNAQVTSTQYQNSAEILDDIDDALSGMNYTYQTTVSADSRNAALAPQGYSEPPYTPQTPVVQYQQTSSTQYVRVFTTGSNGNKIGRWLMKYSDIQGLTPAEIQSKFMLPNPPTHYCYVYVPTGTTIYVGVVNNSSISGTLQYELAEILSESYYGTSMLLP
ncbi:MAG: DNRLRE domain-containing protein [Oscillospiraceae bacterium]|nr:DNRLRE domain-containing protein [Oscillospiraceae bacterium]